MRIGVPKEIKTQEYRVGLTPASVRELTHRGHSVLVQTGAGRGIGMDDPVYRKAGAKIVSSATEIFQKAEMIVKVKEPQLRECKMLRPGQILFTYLHLAPDLAQTKALMKSGCTAIAYETVTDANGRLPLLAPMSEVAGRMSIQVGARFLEKTQGGSGILLGGVPGVASASVVILGGGVSGTHAARMAMGMGAEVTVIDRSGAVLDRLDMHYGERLHTVFSTMDSVEQHVLAADLVIGSVLIPGAAAPKLVTRNMVKRMKKGSVLVDIAIDQGGCFEASKPTTHDDPTFIVDGVVHYCVANMPGAVARTSTLALNNATLPFVLALADKGYPKALIDNVHLRRGLNVVGGAIAYQAVAEAHGLPFETAERLLGV